MDTVTVAVEVIAQEASGSDGGSGRLLAVVLLIGLIAGGVWLWRRATGGASSDGQSRPAPGLAAPAGWLADPTGRHQHRYWNGANWTEHVSDNGVTATDALASAAAQPASPPTGRPARSPSARQQLGTFQWLALSIGLAAVGAVLVNNGKRETVNAIGVPGTEFSAGGLFGASLLCLAVAMFFGRGTFRSIGRLVRGEGTLGDLLFAGSSFRWAVITLGALCLSCVFLFLAAGA